MQITTRQNSNEKIQTSPLVGSHFSIMDKEKSELVDSVNVGVLEYARTVGTRVPVWGPTYLDCIGKNVVCTAGTCRLNMTN